MDQIHAGTQLEPVASVIQSGKGFGIAFEARQPAGDRIPVLRLKQNIKNICGTARRNFARLQHVPDLCKDMTEYGIAGLCAINIVEKGKIRDIHRYYGPGSIRRFQYLFCFQPESKLIPAAGYLIHKSNIGQTPGVFPLQNDKKAPDTYQKQYGDKRQHQILHGQILYAGIQHGGGDHSKNTPV